MSAPTTTSILFVGDMHLGRRPSGLPAELQGDPGCGPVGAWRRVVQIALDHKVQAVALAGDLVHQANAAFGAYGPLEAGVRDLTAAGIAVCAVAGNHDAATLPRMADRIEGFTVLGVGGTWSEHLLDSGPGPNVRIVGWSFAREHHSQSPFEAPLPAPETGLVTLGLLHCDLGASRSPYAPVTADELRSTGYDRWYLGHEHVPGDPASGDPFYLGSLTPLDPSETGAHGPVLVTIGADGRPPLAERLPLAPVRWEHVNVAVAEAEGSVNGSPRNDLPHLLSEAAISQWRRLESEQPDLRALGLRIELTGEVSDPVAWDRAAKAQELEDLVVDQGGTSVFIQRVTSALRAPCDLLALASGSDPAGLLARRILVLECTDGSIPQMSDPAAERERLVTAARACLEAVDQRPVFRHIEGDDSQQVLADLAHVARRTLDSLLAQKGDGHATD
jgi:DNA repair protein SbcD/Mre11